MNESAETSSSHLITFGKLVLDVADVQPEAVTPSHFYGEEVEVVLLDFRTRGILGEKHLGNLLEIIEKTRW